MVFNTHNLVGEKAEKALFTNMKYKCENELHTFNFKDFGISEIKLSDGKINIYTEGGVARYDNSCNETLEERYISECEIQMINCQIDKFVLEGGKYYNADDVLLKEVPDTVIEKDKYQDTVNKFKEEGVIFFFSGKMEDGKYKTEMAVDVESDTYWLNITSEKVIVGFDRFMNKVIS